MKYKIWITKYLQNIQVTSVHQGHWSRSRSVTAAKSMRMCSVCEQSACDCKVTSLNHLFVQHLSKIFKYKVTGVNMLKMLKYRGNVQIAIFYGISRKCQFPGKPSIMWSTSKPRNLEIGWAIAIAPALEQMYQ